VSVEGRLSSYTQQLHSISVNHSPNPTPNPNPHNPTPNPTHISLLSVQSYFSSVEDTFV